MFSSTAGFWFAVTIVYTGFTEFSTGPRSPMWIGAPAGVVFTTMLAISAGVRACPLTRLSTSSCRFSISPGESTRLVRVMASSSPGMFTWLSSSFAGSGRTSNSGSCPPCTTTVDTPPSRFSLGFSS